MPTECERSITSPSSSSAKAKVAAELKDNLTDFYEDSQTNNMMEGDMSTSQTSTTSNGSSCNGGRKTSITSADPTAYVAKARVTRPNPPPPPYNPMQFVQIKPCHLYQTAQEQLKKAEEVKKIKEIRKEEPEDWQNNLDNWKSSRRKRVEHIIDRVVEVKKLELEEHDRTRRKSKTFSEMIEERGDRPNARPLNKLVSLAVYAEDEANDLSDLGIGTSSASGKSSLSEDYDNNSVMSDNAAELDKAITNSNSKTSNESTIREYISSPGYETSSSTAPASSPDPCEYTYEGAIQDYKQRVSRAASGLTSVALNKLTSQQQQLNSKESTPERAVKETAYPPRRGSKIEDRLMGFEVQSPSEECIEKNKVDVPKVDISKRKEIFESQQQQQQKSSNEPKSQSTAAGSATSVPRVTLRDRFKMQDSSETINEQPKRENNRRLSGDITSIKERLQNLEQQQNLVNGANGKITANKLVDIPVPPLKERLSSLQNAATKEEVRKPPVVLVDARQLEIMKSEDQKVKQSIKDNVAIIEQQQQQQQQQEQEISVTLTKPDDGMTTEDAEIDKDDSGIHTADDIDLEERLQADQMKKEQELKLNAAIEALALEEKQLSEAANAVNQIEAEFEELSLGSVAALPPLASSNSSATPITNDHMEYSVSSTNNSSLSPTQPSSESSDSSLNLNNTTGVQGVDCKVTSSLRRKPTNEMVHAKNLLKIFKETFQNDIELDEDEINEEHETKSVKESCQETRKPVSLNIKSQVFQNSNTPSSLSNESPKTPSISANINSSHILATRSLSPPAIPPRTSTPRTLNSPNSPILFQAQTYNAKTLSETSAPSSNPPMSPSGIPRSMNPSGKPPMSPLAIRSTTKFVVVTPPASPSLGRKSDSQFSINGRVEIFNSKNVANPTNNSNAHKSTTPMTTAKKTQLPYINATTPKSLQTDNIVLPQQQQQQQTEQAATTKHHQQQQHETTVIETLPTTTVTTAESAATSKQTKSMPSQQMVNEPQMTLDGEIHHQHEQPNQTNDSMKQQQQQPEVVICAPPITILNPDELPKPNTVKNLSSCFQQQDETTPIFKSKIITPKPLPRSRIPQATPPQSPISSRRHVCYSSSEQTPSSALEDQNNLTSANIQKSSASALEDQKKLSIISASSNSSTSTDSTVIEANKKLSIMSDASSTSIDIPPTLVQTSAQVHKEPENETHAQPLEISQEDSNKPKPMNARTLDKEATQALIDEMIKAETMSRVPVASPTGSSSPSSPKTNFLKFGEIKPYQSSATKTPTSPQLSPKSELFRTNKPLVVSTLYDKYLPEPLPPNNQRTPQISPKPKPKAIETSPTIIIPADLPALPECPPNESSLYKLASSTPHSPTNSSSTPEKNLVIDSALCNSLLTSLAPTTEIFQRQITVEEDLCQKVDKETLPFDNPITGFMDISKHDIKRCDGLSPSSAQKLQSTTQRQHTVEEEKCQKMDITELPDGKQQPITGFKSISPTEIRKCDNFFGTNSAKPDSKHNSPIMQARAAHSKALIETCEKIIAEEKQASSQLKSSLPSTPKQTPIMPRKSKIPKPLASCCTATESINEADLKILKQKDQTTSSPPHTPPEDKTAVIARMHVVETQIKVTTTTPPASPKVLNKPQPSPKPAKKTKNIFEFLKKNFGVGGSSQTEEPSELKEPESPDSSSKPDVTAASENKVLVLSAEDLQDLDEVKYDEIHKIDNSKFYLPANDLDEATPPPLPKTPAPVNIEIIRKITTDEIFEDGKTEMDLTKEIDDLLDDELNKLNREFEMLEKLRKQ